MGKKRGEIECAKPLLKHDKYEILSKKMVNNFRGILGKNLGKSREKIWEKLREKVEGKRVRKAFT